jgi:hypothetical protein
MSRISWVVLLVALMLVSALRGAEDIAALINQELDKQVILDLDATFPQAMDAIEQKTHVRIEEDPVIYDLLPWGRDTAVKAKVKDKTLRDALDAITRKVGLRFALRDQGIEISPSPALRRLGQRANWDELQMLDLLSSTPIGLETDRPTVKRLIEAVDTKLVEIDKARGPEKKTGFAVENRISDAVPQDKTVYVPRNASVADALESLHKETKGTWHPWDKNVMIVTKEEVTRRMLDKPLSIIPGDRGMDVQQVLADVSNRTGVPFEYQPGVIAQLPPEARAIRGVLENAKGIQILGAISAATGLGYTIVDDHVVIAQPGAGGAAGAAAQPRDPAMIFIPMDNGMQILVPSSQVPDDVKQYLRFKTQRRIAELREAMKLEGFKPTPAPPPATRPIGDDKARDL